MNNSRDLQKTREAGIALVLTMLALALISVLGLIMTMNATMELRISSNSESHAQAALAAISGLEHARIAVNRLDFDALLRGPDGVYDTSAAYMNEAKTFGFRLPFSLLTAQKLNIESPLDSIEYRSDDGIISTGALWGISGAALIPQEGIALWADNPDGTEKRIVSRYFVKVTDNNEEASELAADATDNPFIDGDGIIIVRSIGVARTIADTAGESVRNNAAAVFESRLRRSAAWDLGPALTIIGATPNAAFSGSPEIYGGSAAGIGILNTDSVNAGLPEVLLPEASAVAGNISGGGFAIHSIRDISDSVRNHRDKSLLFSAGWLMDFIERRSRNIADIVYNGDMVFTGASQPFLGFYDKTKPWNDSLQKPYFVFVNGNLTATNGLAGAGVLVVTGSLQCSGNLDYRGLILVLGAGQLALGAEGPGIRGGVITGRLLYSGGEAAFGAAQIDIGGFTRITADKELVRMALRLFPVEQISFREIAGSDP